MHKNIFCKSMMMALSLLLLSNASYPEKKDPIERTIDQANSYSEKKLYDKAIEECKKAEDLLGPAMLSKTNEIINKFKQGTYDKQTAETLFGAYQIIKQLELLQIYVIRASAFIGKSQSLQGEKKIEILNKALDDIDKASSLFNISKITDKKWKDYVMDLLAWSIQIKMKISEEQRKAPKYAYITKGDEYLYKKKYKEAVKYYTLSINLDPKLEEAYEKRARAYKEDYDNDKAIVDYTKLIELNSKSGEPYKNRGELFLGKNQYEKAENDLSNALKLNPDSCTYRYLRGVALNNLKMSDKAIEDWSNTLKKCPQYGDVYDELIKAYIKKEQYGKALSTADEYVEKSGGPYPLFLRGSIYAKYKKSYSKAIDDLSKAIDHYYKYNKSSYCSAHLLRGICHAYDDEWGKAVQDWRKSDCSNPAYMNMINSKSDVNACDSNGASVFMWAVHEGDFDMVKMLYKKGADIKKQGTIWIDKNQGSYYGGILQVAAGKMFGAGRLEILKYLVEECSLDINEGEMDPKTGKKNKWSAIFSACAEGNSDRIEYLINKGASINLKSGDEYGNKSPLETYLSGGLFNHDEKIPLLFLEKGAIADINNKKLLFYSAHKGFNKVIAVLLNKGMDINSQDENGASALHYAINGQAHKTVSFLIEKGMNLNHRATITEKGKKAGSFTPLMLAKKYRLKEIEKTLSQAGAR